MAHRRLVSSHAHGRPAQPEAPPHTYAIETRDGTRTLIGTGPAAFTMRVADNEAWAALNESDLYRAATAYVAADFDIDGDLVAAVQWWRAHHPPRRLSWWMRALVRLNVESWFQSWRQARQNIQFHYDRSNRFYQQFLDRRMVYSEAYFASPRTSLDAAQLAKLDLVAGKLELSAGDRFLDVGCGWGALVIHAAERYSAVAHGCSVSTQQCLYATEQIERRRLGDRVTVENCDYRALRGTFDKIASIGMYEHVGRHRLNEYFSTLAKLLRPGGMMLNSGIARLDGAEDDLGSVFVRRFVFPGGELPPLSAVIKSAERAGLEVVDVENLRRHYGRTCAEWVRRLQAHRDAGLAIVGESTYRTWLLYLAGSAACFERGDLELFHVLLRKPD